MEDLTLEFSMFFDKVLFCLIADLSCHFTLEVFLSFQPVTTGSF